MNTTEDIEAQEATANTKNRTKDDGNYSKI